jgi:hypothetical protein
VSTVAPTAPPGAAQSVVRRIVVFAILFALVVIGATGVSGLIERVIGAGRAMTADDCGLALSLAFALIGAPLAGVVWWWERRRLASDPAERASLVWSLYLLGITLLSLIIAVTSLATALGAAIDGEFLPAELSTAIVFLGVWIWHRHMRRSVVTAPTRLAAAPVELSALFGLVVAAAAAIDAIAQPISQALAGASFVMAGSQYWVISTLQALIWCAIGALVWWWHWFRERAKDAPGALAAVLLVIVVAAAAATTLFAIGTALFVLLRRLFDTDPFAQTVAPLDVAIAAGLIGGIVWVYHARVLAGRSARARRSGRLVISAIALIGAASGFGVIVNALLASFSGPLIDDDPRTLLLGGISALVVGAPVWWLAWRPAREVTVEEAADPSRRVYLVVVFGASAIVAIVTLLIIGYRLFEFGLDGGTGGLIERVRAPFGLLSATAIVFGYHFAIWRRDRAVAGTVVRRQAIGRVVLVTGGDAGELAALVRAQTGAAVTVWRAADDAVRLGAEDLPVLLAALEGVSAPRVLVVPEAGGGVRTVALAD